MLTIANKSGLPLPSVLAEELREAEGRVESVRADVERARETLSCASSTFSNAVAELEDAAADDLTRAERLAAAERAKDGLQQARGEFRRAAKRWPAANAWLTQARQRAADWRALQPSPAGI